MQHDWLYEYDADGETPLTRVSKSGSFALATAVLMKQAEDLEEALATQHEEEPAQPCHDAAPEHAARPADSGADRMGETALHKAVRTGNYDAARMLLEAGAESSPQDVFGITPMHWAAFTGRTDLAQLLLDRGADVNAREYFAGGNTPYGIARMLGYADLIALFRDYGGVT